ncbi:low molecular weight protein arginine phosphatase [Carboxydothermus pertinax]|uniref:Protein-tyrosine-phosphatase n=1 Tax=Carboxydothermus pertinax TaxID=870242 RepID=A0A1L8CTE2_9THEO|nr:low molecular weight protein arginine phosphatase [Carboxydothermus pertinax]GAV22196.1 protein-tyrosine-phosphatase [Carboxydothermus pertinax]
MNILFVCTGNTCRSPMAQYLFNKIAAEKGLAHEALSVGLYALDGDPATEQAVQALQEEGIDLSSHKATRLFEGITREADLILTMSRGHKEALLQLFPDLGNKVYTLKEYVGEEGDVADPFGGDIEVYRQTALELKQLILKLIAKIEAKGAEEDENSDRV